MASIDKIDTLLEYIKEVKPYSTKVLDVTVEHVHNENLMINVADEVENDVEREGNSQYDYYLPYDRVEAFTFSNNNQTAVQDSSPNRPTDYAVSKVNLDVSRDVPSFDAIPIWYPDNSPAGVIRVYFLVDALNVDPDQLSIGVMKCEDNFVNLPFINPINNDQLIGYYENDYGYKADGTIINNNVIVETTGVTYTSGDYVVVEIDFVNEEISFYKGVTYVTSIPISDPTFKYSFGFGVLADNSSTSITLSYDAPF